MAFNTELVYEKVDDRVVIFEENFDQIAESTDFMLAENLTW